MSTKATTAKVNAAAGLEVRAKRDGACGLHRKALATYAKAAELFEEVGNHQRAADMLQGVIEHAEKQRWKLLRKPKFQH
jgi:hypothetical protein